MDVPHKVFDKWCQYCVRRGEHISFEKWTRLTLSGDDGLLDLLDYGKKVLADDEMVDVLYLVRRKDTGEFYRGGKERYGVTQRTPWTPEPRKAKFYWQRNQVKRLFEGTQRADEMPEYEIVQFALVEMINAL